MDSSRVCRHVFLSAELLNSYVRGIQEATREKIEEQVRRLPQNERASMVSVSKLATSKGRSHRALLNNATSFSSRGSTNTIKPLSRAPPKSALMLIGAPSFGPPPPHDTHDHLGHFYNGHPRTLIFPSMRQRPPNFYQRNDIPVIHPAPKRKICAKFTARVLHGREELKTDDDRSPRDNYKADWSGNVRHPPRLLAPVMLEL